jgi:putative heme iron utilization protein
MTSSRQHAERPVAERTPVPEPSLAERARTLVACMRQGTLSTHSRKLPGFPFGSVMPYAPDESGRPLFLISSMAMHTQNLKADRRASLLVTQPGGDDPLGAARVTLLGESLPVPPPELAAARALYLARHENAGYWVDFNDFSFYRLEAAGVYFIGGFGVMDWVTSAEYAAGRPDPLAESAPAILRHMNQDHGAAVLLLARAFGGEKDAETAAMTAVDRLGFQVRLTNGERVYGVRIAFPRAVASTEEVRMVLVEMVHQARGAG